MTCFLIDEIQFFDEMVITNIRVLLNKFKKTVIVAGLDLDFKGEPFIITSALMGYAEEVVKLHAVCTTCGNDAWVSAKKEEGTERVQLGADDLYYLFAVSVSVRLLKMPNPEGDK
jgi:thymidine kinase